MLRLRNCILTHLPSYTASPVYPLHRLFSAPARPISPNPSFAVEEYLVDTCGLTRPQALEVSPMLSHVKNPTNPDAVVAFLAGLGLSRVAVAAAVARDPQLLCASVERTLAPTVLSLTGLGLSRAEIARLVSLAPASFRGRSSVSNLPYYISLFGSCDNLLRAIKNRSSILRCSLEEVVKPNVAFLQECGLSACDITKLCNTATWLLTVNPERLPVAVASAEGLGVPRGSAMFRHALHGVAFLGEEKIATQVEDLKNMFGWSDEEARVAVSKHPFLMRRSCDVLRRRSEFLISEVGLEPTYIAHRPAIVLYSLERRLRPRYYVLKYLKENGLLDRDRDYYTAVACIEKVFVEKFICPHKEAAAHLAQDYEAARRGEVPARFRFA